jgi:hypothetical protein
VINPYERCQELAKQISPFTLKPVGLASCGCPNNLLGQYPVLHICQVCGFGGADTLHTVFCPGCQYLDDI